MIINRQPLEITHPFVVNGARFSNILVAARTAVFQGADVLAGNAVFPLAQCKAIVASEEERQAEDLKRKRVN